MSEACPLVFRQVRFFFLRSDDVRRKSQSRVIAVVDDLFFAAKIEAAARALGVALVQVAEPAQLWSAAAEAAPRLIILDLNVRTIAPIETLQRIKAEPRFAGTRVIGFCSHVQTALQHEAAQAGADAVMSRSEFTVKLPGILKTD
jgi:DNA-binding NarL/FixJ family response regulator